MISIPNMISIARIIMIPFFVASFMTGNTTAAAIILGVSAASDLLDGYIARRFNMVTELGKMLDPISDKLTLFSICAVMIVKYPALLPLFLLLIIKEILMFFFSIRLLRRNLRPTAANIYGKIATFAFYAGMFAIVLFGNMSNNVRLIILVGVAILMIIAFISYAQVYVTL
ncbi:MAG: CDP-alcohol phosphatidyltransferase family protein, partial [Oscillospiraceae bacterium]